MNLQNNKNSNLKKQLDTIPLTTNSIPLTTNTLNSIKIFDINLSYLTIIVLTCGIILSIYDYSKTYNHITTLIIAIYFIINAFNINCMTLGNCYYWSIIHVIMLILLTIWAIMHFNEFNTSINNKFVLINGQ